LARRLRSGEGVGNGEVKAYMGRVKPVVEGRAPRVTVTLRPEIGTIRNARDINLLTGQRSEANRLHKRLHVSLERIVVD